MAEPPRRIRWGDATLAVDGGRIVAVERDGAEVLTGFDVRFSDYDVEPVHRVDEDEIESVWALGEGRSVTVRHNFDRTWSVRVLVVNDADEALTLEHVLVEATPASGFFGWCWGSGALGRLALLSTSGAESLVFAVQRGMLRERAAGGGTGGVAGELGPIRVPARSRHVISLRGEWRRPEELTEDLPSWLPPLELAAGEPLQLSTPDLALTVPAQTSVDEIGDITEVLPDGGVGARSLVLTGAQGTIILDSVWAPSLSDTLDNVASSVLNEAERRQGVALLDPAAAVVLQRSSLGGTDVEDVLDRALEMTPSGDPWSVVLRASAHASTGREDHLARAATALRGLPAHPGCGVAAMHVVLAQLASGSDPEDALSVLARLAAKVSDPATAFELAVVGAPVSSPIAGLARTAAAELGDGMPGRPSGLRPVDIAQRVAALCLAEAAGQSPDPGEVGFGQRRVGLLVQSWTRRLLVEQPTAEVLAWLSVDVDS